MILGNGMVGMCNFSSGFRLGLGTSKVENLTQAVGNEIVDEAPRFSRIGLILIRTIVMDPSNPDNIEQIQEMQKKAFIEAMA